MAEINAATAEVTDNTREEEVRVCLFSMNDDVYAIPVEFLTEILISQKIFPVPATPPHVLGVINLRGNIVPIVDIRDILSLKRRSTPSQIAVLKINNLMIGIVVDTVWEVIAVPISTVLSIPGDPNAPGGKGQSRFLKSLIQRQDGAAVLLNVEQIIDEIKL